MSGSDFTENGYRSNLRFHIVCFGERRLTLLYNFTIIFGWAIAIQV